MLALLSRGIACFTNFVHLESLYFRPARSLIVELKVAVLVIERTVRFEVVNC